MCAERLRHGVNMDVVGTTSTRYCSATSVVLISSRGTYGPVLPCVVQRHTRHAKVKHESTQRTSVPTLAACHH